MTLAFPKPTPKEKPHRPFSRKTPMKPVSDKRRAHRASEKGKEDEAYLLLVKSLPCVACGAPAPSEAHHCKDRPPHGLEVYDRLPCAGRKSAHTDTIPLCSSCHRNGPNAYHVAPAAWRERHDPDWTHIEATRKAVAAMEDDLLKGVF